MRETFAHEASEYCGEDVSPQRDRPTSRMRCGSEWVRHRLNSELNRHQHLLDLGHGELLTTNRIGSDHDLEFVLCLFLGEWRLSKCFQLEGNANPPCR
jgi:hypothetical protein